MANSEVMWLAACAVALAASCTMDFGAFNMDPEGSAGHAAGGGGSSTGGSNTGGDGTGGSQVGGSATGGSGTAGSATGGTTGTGGSGGGTVSFPPGELGGPCLGGDVCNDGECCSAGQCADTCMVKCQNANQCPEAGMGCEHGYCLYPCNNNDDDCLQPGYTCQHGGLFCEL